MEDLFRSLVWDYLIKAALTRLFAAFPILGWGPIGWVVTWLVTKYANLFYDEMKLWINMAQIAFANKEAEDAFNHQSAKLAIIAREKGITSPEFMEAKNAAKEGFSQLIRFGVAR